MPAATRTLPSGHAKQVVKDALAKAGAFPGRSRKSAARIARFTGPGHSATDIGTVLDDLVTDGDASEAGGEYRLTDQGLTDHRHHPRPRYLRTAA